MIATQFGLDTMLHTCCETRNRDRLRRGLAQCDTGDYCLFDELGQTLGTVVAVNADPALGKNAPTVLLRR